MTTTRREPVKTRYRDGQRVCSCGCGEVPKPPRRSWFSDACVTAWRLKNDPAFIRQAVFARDKGICALCGCDTVAVFRSWKEAYKQAWRLVSWFITKRLHEARNDQSYIEAERDRMMTRWSPPGAWSLHRSTGWDVDHIVPVVKGGGQCDLSNLRILCHPCHKRVTADLAAERAKERKANKMPTRQEFLPL